MCLATDVFLLAHMFAKSRFHVKENYKLDPEHFDTQSGLELQAILKMPATELNYDMTCLKRASEVVNHRQCIVILLSKSKYEMCGWNV